HRDDVKLNQFGGAVGGPLRKNQLWFYGFYEGLRELTAFPAAGYAPTAAMFSGNFTEADSALYDPATFSAVTNNRAPFPGGFQIPLSRINPVSRNLLRYHLPGST